MRHRWLAAIVGPAKIRALRLNYYILASSVDLAIASYDLVDTRTKTNPPPHSPPPNAKP